jgi:hypothetical protein
MMDVSNQPILNTEPENIQAEIAIVTAKDTGIESFLVGEDSPMPICTVDFKNSNIEALNASVEVGPGTFYNDYYGNSWIMHFPGQSFIKFSTTIEHLDSTKKYLLDLIHLSSIVDGSLMDSPISIYVNGKSVVCGHNPHNPNYVHFDEGAQTNYWIQSLSIIQS